MLLWGLSVVVEWSLVLIIARAKMPSSAEDYHVGFVASLARRNQGAIHTNMGALFAGAPLLASFASGLNDLCNGALASTDSRDSETLVGQRPKAWGGDGSGLDHGFH